MNSYCNYCKSKNLIIITTLDNTSDDFIHHKDYKLVSFTKEEKNIVK